LRPDEVFSQIGKLPYMRLDHARIFYDLVVANNLRTGLELGFFHGASTAYLAGAIQDVGAGQLTTIDLTQARNLNPSIEWVLNVTGLSHLVQIYYEPRSFNWRLMKMLQEGRYESFDFCYFDGGHTWYDTGFAFCLVERLLRPGGWVVFDDLHYNFRNSNNRNMPWVKQMPEEEQTIPQVKLVFELLVESNPYFGSFRRLGRFGFAQKRIPVWSIEQRAQNHQEIIISKAIERAHFDPEFRADLISKPARVLSNLANQPMVFFQNLCFADTDRLAPISSIVDETGKTVIPLERPAWDRITTEAELKRLLDDSP
jgi:predicted O-methyltransferase YrrM